jgi:PAS domain S-box-containing protein
MAGLPGSAPSAEDRLVDPRIDCRILIVDDSVHKLLSIEAILGDLDHELVLTDSGESALRHLLVNDFAAILLDIKMPGMDGFETARMIRSHRRCEHTPIIFMTAYSEAEADMTRAYSLGAIDFIFAPFIPEILRAKVSAFADLFIKSIQVKRQAEALRQEAEHRADALALRLDGLLNTLEVGVFQATTEGRLVSANPAFRRLLDTAGTVGTDGDTCPLLLQDIFHDPSQFRSMQEEFQRQGQVKARAVQLHRGDGATAWVLWTQTVVGHDRHRRLIEGVVEDISDQKRIEAELVDKSEELARSNAQLEYFAYAASHDMQEPLRSVSLVASMLRLQYADRLDECGREWLDKLCASSARICRMIRDALAFARVGQGGLDHGPVDCGRVLGRVVANLGELIVDSRAEVVINAKAMVDGNESLLEQLFQNLISNGIKFCSADSPRVRVDASRLGDVWQFAIADNGIGIPDEHRESIFRLFHRLHDHHCYQGSGIGLALCQRIVEHHAGRIWVESVEHKGSTFFVTLPAVALRAESDGTRSGSGTTLAGVHARRADPRSV